MSLQTSDQENQQPLAHEATAEYISATLRNSNSDITTQGRLFTPSHITIFEKLGRPSRFHRPAQVPPGIVGHELTALRKLMLDNRIQLLVSSPHISDTELFNFLTGEFMDLRITDDGSPLFHCFLYENYRPDPYFDNEQTALNRCIRPLFDRSMTCPTEIFMEQVSLNQYGQLSRQGILRHIETFKNQYDEIVSLEINVSKTNIHDRTCEVTGSHATGFIRGNKCLLRTGRWTVRFGMDERLAWKIESVRVEDVDL